MKVIKGYKVFNPNWTARHDNFQYEVGKEYEMGGEITPCERGFHFCENLKDCFKYYKFSPDLKVTEVEGTGQIKRHEDKICCSHIRIVKEIPLSETLNLINDGENNIGIVNQGIGNQGDYNRGSDNQGNCNQGDYNRGSDNQGNRNQGNYNQGNCNQGYNNQGGYNQGHNNQGSDNQGHNNQGSNNQGHNNRGSDNQGNNNQGNRNQGESNKGDNNIGIGNKGDYIVGLWCTQKQPFYLFNKLCRIPLDEFKQSENYGLLMQLTQAGNPELEWKNFTPEEKRITLSTENITPEIFKELFDIDVTTDK